MKISYFGHASIGLETSSGLRVLLDPYKPDAFEGRLAFAPIPGQWDYLCISHEHLDHNYVGPEFGSPVVLRGNHWEPRLKVTVKKGKHGDAGGTVDAEVRVSMLELEGLKIIHPGDFGGPLSQEWLNLFSQADILFLPVGGYFTLGPTEGREVVRRCNPRITVPIHYWTPSTHLRVGPVAPFLEEQPRVRTIADGEVTVTAKTLPSLPEIWVMKPLLGRHSA